MASSSGHSDGATGGAKRQACNARLASELASSHTEATAGGSTVMSLAGFDSRPANGEKEVSEMVKLLLSSWLSLNRRMSEGREPVPTLDFYHRVLKYTMLVLLRHDAQLQPDAHAHLFSVMRHYNATLAQRLPWFAAVQDALDRTFQLATSHRSRYIHELKEWSHVAHLMTGDNVHALIRKIENAGLAGSAATSLGQQQDVSSNVSSVKLSSYIESSSLDCGVPPALPKAGASRAFKPTHSSKLTRQPAAKSLTASRRRRRSSSGDFTTPASFAVEAYQLEAVTSKIMGESSGAEKPSTQQATYTTAGVKICNADTTSDRAQLGSPSDPVHHDSRPASITPVASSSRLSTSVSVATRFADVGTGRQGNKKASKSLAARLISVKPQDDLLKKRLPVQRHCRSNGDRARNINAHVSARADVRGRNPDAAGADLACKIEHSNLGISHKWVNEQSGAVDSLSSVAPALKADSVLALKSEPGATGRLLGNKILIQRSSSSTPKNFGREDHRLEAVVSVDRKLSVPTSGRVSDAEPAVSIQPQASAQSSLVENFFAAASVVPSPATAVSSVQRQSRSWDVQSWLDQQEQVVPERPPPDDATPTDEVLEKLNDVYRDAAGDDVSLANFCKTLANLNCHRGVQLGWRCFQRTSDIPECTEALVSTFFLKDIMDDESERCCTRELMVLWVRLQKHKKVSPPDIGELASFLLDRHASVVSGLFYLMFDVLWEECGHVGYVSLIEIMLRGLGIDLNSIEECSHRGAIAERLDIEGNVSRMMLKWCIMFSDFPLVLRECALSSFLLRPTHEALDLIIAESLRICERRDRTCRCYGHHIDDMSEPQQPGRPLYEVLPQDDMFFFEPVLDTELPGVSYDLLKDMVTVLHAVRPPIFALNDDLEKYMEDFYQSGKGVALPSEERLITMRSKSVSLSNSMPQAPCQRLTSASRNLGKPAAPTKKDSPASQPMLAVKASHEAATPAGGTAISADSESDSDSSVGSSEFERRLERQRRAALASTNVGQTKGGRAAGACHKLKTRDKNRPSAAGARRSARQLQRERNQSAAAAATAAAEEQRRQQEQSTTSIECDSSGLCLGQVDDEPQDAEVIIVPASGHEQGLQVVTGEGCEDAIEAILHDAVSIDAASSGVMACVDTASIVTNLASPPSAVPQILVMPIEGPVDDQVPGLVDSALIGASSHHSNLQLDTNCDEEISLIEEPMSAHIKTHSCAQPEPRSSSIVGGVQQQVAVIVQRRPSDKVDDKCSPVNSAGSLDQSVSFPATNSVMNTLNQSGPSFVETVPFPLIIEDGHLHDSTDAHSSKRLVNGPKIQKSSFAVAQQSVLVPETTDMTPVAIDTALTALQLPSRRRSLLHQQQSSASDSVTSETNVMPAEISNLGPSGNVKFRKIHQPHSSSPIYGVGNHEVNVSAACLNRGGSHPPPLSHKVQSSQYASSLSASKSSLGPDRKVVMMNTLVVSPDGSKVHQHQTRQPRQQLNLPASIYTTRGESAAIVRGRTKIGAQSSATGPRAETANVDSSNSAATYPQKRSIVVAVQNTAPIGSKGRARGSGTRTSLSKGVKSSSVYPAPAVPEVAHAAGVNSSEPQEMHHVQPQQQLKAPNFRAILDRFDALCGVPLECVSLAEQPVRFEVISSSVAGEGSMCGFLMPKLDNVHIRTSKRVPSGVSGVLSVSSDIALAGDAHFDATDDALLQHSTTVNGRRVVSSATPKSDFLSRALPPDPTRGKISADLLRRLKEEVDNRCSGAPITQFFKQQKKPVFVHRKEVAVKFSIRKQNFATAGGGSDQDGSEQLSVAADSESFQAADTFAVDATAAVHTNEKLYVDPVSTCLKASCGVSNKRSSPLPQTAVSIKSCNLSSVAMTDPATLKSQRVLVDCVSGVNVPRDGDSQIKPIESNVLSELQPDMSTNVTNGGLANASFGLLDAPVASGNGSKGRLPGSRAAAKSKILHRISGSSSYCSNSAVTSSVHQTGVIVGHNTRSGGGADTVVAPLTLRVAVPSGCNSTTLTSGTLSSTTVVRIQQQQLQQPQQSPRLVGLAGASAVTVVTSVPAANTVSSVSSTTSALSLSNPGASISATTPRIAKLFANKRLGVSSPGSVETNVITTTTGTAGTVATPGWGSASVGLGVPKKAVATVSAATSVAGARSDVKVDERSLSSASVSSVSLASTQQPQTQQVQVSQSVVVRGAQHQVVSMPTAISSSGSSSVVGIVHTVPRSQMPSRSSQHQQSLITSCSTSPRPATLLRQTPSPVIVTSTNAAPMSQQHHLSTNSSQSSIGIHLSPSACQQQTALLQSTSGQLHPNDRSQHQHSLQPTLTNLSKGGMSALISTGSTLSPSTQQANVQHILTVVSSPQEASVVSSDSLIQSTTPVNVRFSASGGSSVGAQSLKQGASIAGSQLVVNPHQTHQQVTMATIKNAQGGQQNVLMKVITNSSPGTTIVPVSAGSFVNSSEDASAGRTTLRHNLPTRAASGIVAPVSAVCATSALSNAACAVTTTFSPSKNSGSAIVPAARNASVSACKLQHPTRTSPSPTTLTNLNSARSPIVQIGAPVICDSSSNCSSAAGTASAQSGHTVVPSLLSGSPGSMQLISSSSTPQAHSHLQVVTSKPSSQQLQHQSNIQSVATPSSAATSAGDLNGAVAPGCQVFMSTGSTTVGGQQIVKKPLPASNTETFKLHVQPIGGQRAANAGAVIPRNTTPPSVTTNVVQPVHVRAPTATGSTAASPSHHQAFTSTAIHALQSAQTQQQPLRSQQRITPSSASSTGTVSATGGTNKIMIPVNSLLQQGAIATSVNGLPVLIIKNNQIGQQQIVHMRQIQPLQQSQSGQPQSSQSVQPVVSGVQTVSSSSRMRTVASTCGDHAQSVISQPQQIAVLRQPAALKQQSVVAAQAATHTSSTHLTQTNRLSSLQVSLPSSPASVQHTILPAGQGSGLQPVPGRPGTVAVVSGSFGQQMHSQPSQMQVSQQHSSAVIAGGGTLHITTSPMSTKQTMQIQQPQQQQPQSLSSSAVVSQASASTLHHSISLTAVPGGTQPGVAANLGGSIQMQQSHHYAVASGQAIPQQVVHLAARSGSSVTLTSPQTIVVNQSGQRLVTVSPDVLQAAVKAGQTKIITYKPALLQQSIAGGRAKVIAAEVVANHSQGQSQAHPQQQQVIHRAESPQHSLVQKVTSAMQKRSLSNKATQPTSQQQLKAINPSSAVGIKASGSPKIMQAVGSEPKTTLESVSTVKVVGMLERPQEKIQQQSSQDKQSQHDGNLVSKQQGIGSEIFTETTPAVDAQFQKEFKQLVVDATKLGTAQQSQVHSSVQVPADKEARASSPRQILTSSAEGLSQVQRSQNSESQSLLKVQQATSVPSAVQVVRKMSTASSSMPQPNENKASLSYTDSNLVKPMGSCVLKDGDHDSKNDNIGVSSETKSDESSKAPTGCASVGVANKTSTVAQTIRALGTRQLFSDKERLKEIQPILDEDSLIEQIVAADVNEQMSAIRKSVIQKIHGGRGEPFCGKTFNSNNKDNNDRNKIDGSLERSSEGSVCQSNRNTNQDLYPSSKKSYDIDRIDSRETSASNAKCLMETLQTDSIVFHSSGERSTCGNDAVEALHTVSKALSFAILTESASAIAEDDLDAERTLKDERSVSLSLFSSDEEGSNCANDESSQDSACSGHLGATEEGKSQIPSAPKRRRLQKRFKLTRIFSSESSDSPSLDDNNSDRAARPSQNSGTALCKGRSAACHFLNAFADKMLEKASSGPATYTLQPTTSVSSPQSSASPAEIQQQIAFPNGTQAVINGRVVNVQVAGISVKGGAAMVTDENGEQRRLVLTAGRSSALNTNVVSGISSTLPTKPLVVNQMLVFTSNMNRDQTQQQQITSTGVGTLMRKKGAVALGSNLQLQQQNVQPHTGVGSGVLSLDRDEQGAGSSRYRCKECQRHFFSAYNLRRHLKNVHKIEMGPPLAVSGSQKASEAIEVCGVGNLTAVALAAAQQQPQQSQLLAALNGTSTSMTTSDFSQCRTHSGHIESDPDDSSLGPFVYVSSGRSSSSGVSGTSKTTLTALLEAPSVLQTAPHV